MTGVSWSLVDVVAQLLARDEREAVLGDLLECGESSWQALTGVLSLIIRRHLALWKNWRPWLASLGLALPGSLLLMGFSISVSQSYQHFIDPAILRATGLMVRPGFWLLLCNIFLLMGWSWTGGFVMGSVSRRTVWVSALLSFVPCLFCLTRFRVESLSRSCLLLFLLPAIWGALRGLRVARIERTSAIVLAVAVTVLTIPAWSRTGPWIPNFLLSWPAWYLVATAQPANGEGRPVKEERDGD
jgi:hypothetical protein